MSTMAEIAVCHAASVATHQPGIRSNRRRTTFVQLRKIGPPPQVALQCRSDGPPRMVARSTWSGRERSSHSRFPPVPRVRLVPLPVFLRFSFAFSSPFLRNSPLQDSSGATLLRRNVASCKPDSSAVRSIGIQASQRPRTILRPFCDIGTSQNNDPCCDVAIGTTGAGVARNCSASIHSPAAVATPASMRLAGNIGFTAAT